MSKRRVKEKLPLVLSATALVVAVFGATPLGSAALDAVSFAKNAGSVNGIKASRTPKANQLLALGPNKKFPSSVMGTGPQGPPGPAGPAATSMFAVVNPDGSVYQQSNVGSVQRLDSGVYQITFNRSVDNCAVIGVVGGHRTGPTTWTDPPYKGFVSVRTFGQVAEIRTLTDNGFSGGFQERDMGFHVAAFC
jgi:hypothetical protein